MRAHHVSILLLPSTTFSLISTKQARVPIYDITYSFASNRLNSRRLPRLSPSFIARPTSPLLIKECNSAAAGSSVLLSSSHDLIASADQIEPNHKMLDTPYYLVTKNGLTLSWADIYQKYGNEIEAIEGRKNNDDEHDLLEEDCPPLDSSSLLQLLPRGAYTTCRTVCNGTQVYQFDYHVKRLALSARSILEVISSTSNENIAFGENNVHSEEKGENSTSVSTSDAHFKSYQNHHHRNPSKSEINELELIDIAWETKMAMTCIRSTLEAYKSQYLSKYGPLEQDSEFRITMLSTWEEQDRKCQNNGAFQSVLYCHVGILPQTNSSKVPSDQKHIKVLVHGHGRDNALAKDSKWVSDRKQYTSDASSANSSVPGLTTYEEIILINDNGEMLEGSQTNFYVVHDHKTPPTIITVNEGVLHGSVRDSVLRVCRNNNITVDFRPPTLTDLKKASGVFISSTSRWVMRVHEVVLGDLLLLSKCNDSKGCEDESLSTSFHYPNCQTTENIRMWVLEDVESHSTPIDQDI